MWPFWEAQLNAVVPFWYTIYMLFYNHNDDNDGDDDNNHNNHSNIWNEDMDIICTYIHNDQWMLSYTYGCIHLYLLHLYIYYRHKCPHSCIHLFIQIYIHTDIFTYIQIYLHTYNRVDNTYSVLDIYAGAMIQQELNHFDVTFPRGTH